ncbi:MULTISPECIES: glycosyltransferase family 2 protein [unclassified Clostridium]|uniref:glycosyltransferase family 2 protein n=1 Tax=unclassified Clostridium TaxID=2614128 RepID=UPI002A910152|nr:glycosyltransferase family 2 protein [Clostridium sp.]MCI6690954.1 glycosyltransferase family 2 protein [Clostridium sp.]MDY6226477.1 glycosyltransferase family 2 protein [Clostridium sp.]
MSRIDLIVLNYNDYKTTSKFLEKIKDYKTIDHIVVVDNNSSDDSYELLLKYKSDKIHVIKSEKNGGYSYGNNYGIKYAMKEFNTEYIIISNPDVFFEEKVVDDMIKMYDKEERVAIVAPTMLINGELKWTSWKLPKFKDDLISLSDMLKRWLGDKTLYPKEHFNGEYSFVDVLPGSLFMIPANVMKKIGFFDEDVFLYCEEKMMSKRLLDRGYKNIILNNITYDHQHSVSIGKNINNSIKIYKLMADSTYIYNVKYNNIGFLKKAIYKALVNIMLLRMKLS